MSITPKPKLNDLLKESPEHKYLCSFQGPSRQIDNKFGGSSWIFNLLLDGSEYIYFANNKQHKDDIDKWIGQGYCTLEISVAPAFANGKSYTQYYVEVPDGALQGEAPQSEAPQQQPMKKTPSFNDAISLKSDVDWEKINLGKCRHSYALEVFKYLINKDQKPILTPEMKVKIEEWAKFSMQGMSDIEKETMDPIPF